MNKQRADLLESLKYPALFVVLLWTIKLTELFAQFDFTHLGTYPRKLFGVMGVFTSPLIHGDMSHLMSNSVPLVLLGSMIFFFYPTTAKKVILLIYVLTGVTVWLLARPVYHIGASGLVYGFAAFLFFSGVFRNDVKSLAISFFIIFMYGGIVWGLVPNIPGVSWETHLLGAVIGTLLAYHYRFTDLPPVKQWDEEPDKVSFKYVYEPEKDKDADNDGPIVMP